ncbi:tRNA preQ1(34) S-adenosylmethionine ribosyltransferase-isomerase QueA [Burkholderiaceae bacterium DAT-1]|nr:tRNA preQ1(34) S-adenosylmethionine ribosyltransferase-isomerase QueA [Burkholderiaceae bacterium DAT-1]
MQLSAFDYHLPESLIAQFPPEVRGGSRLMYLGASDVSPADALFTDLPQFLRSGDLLVLNDTRVIKARLHGSKESGGQIEALIERVVNEFDALAMIRASKSPKPGSRVCFAGKWWADVTGREGEFFQLRFVEPVLDVLDQVGELPLPPYIEREASDHDAERYQTVFAREKGAVAAPTAGLHFTDDMFAKLAQLGVTRAFVTLHVGAGTFQPVRVDDIRDHKMHRERYQVPADTIAAIRETRAKGGRVVVVGTTAMRALESSCRYGEFADPVGDTDIFITPGFQFKVADMLLTNFHLPKSTLMMLVSAFAGYERIMQAYHHAVERQYRFFSFGDAMLLERHEHKPL